MIGAAKLDDRQAQNYAGVRTQIPASEMPTVIPQLVGEVYGWLGRQGIAPTGAPFMRFHVINMAGRIDIEIGVPVANPVTGEGRVQAGVLPAGRYASLIYTGVTNGVPASAALIAWAKERGLEWDRWDDPNGDAFAGRYETFLSGPQDDPDPAKWDTEVAIKLADGQAG